MATEKMINFQINGRYFQAPEGMTILEVAKREGIPIPTLCYHEALESPAACAWSRSRTLTGRDGRGS